MAYTKQQVVIDLEEYNDLLKIKEQQENSDLADYQKALFSVITVANRHGHLNMDRIYDSLAMDGLSLMTSSDVIDSGKVIVEKIKKNK